MLVRTCGCREVQRKLAVIGFRGVGKSTLITQLVEDRFVEHYDPTIENTFQKNIRIGRVVFRCSIVDTAGARLYNVLIR